MTVGEQVKSRGLKKGNPRKSNGMIDKDCHVKNFLVIVGCDNGSNVMRTLIKNNDEMEKIIINKDAQNTILK